MKRLLIGTSNKGKAQFYSQVLNRFFPELEVVVPDELGVRVGVEEEGKTFEENAIIKARAWATASHLSTLSVDGGMMIDALDGAPGVYTHRWAGEGTTDNEKLTFLLDQLRGVPRERRRAVWREVVALAKPNGQVITESAEDEGFILEAPVSLPNPWPGLWVVPVWFTTKFSKPWLALTPEEHEQVDSTYHAMRKLERKLYEFLLT